MSSSDVCLIDCKTESRSSMVGWGGGGAILSSCDGRLIIFAVSVAPVVSEEEESELHSIWEPLRLTNEESVSSLTVYHPLFLSCTLPNWSLPSTSFTMTASPIWNWGKAQDRVCEHLDVGTGGWRRPIDDDDDDDVNKMWLHFLRENWKDLGINMREGRSRSNNRRILFFAAGRQYYSLVGVLSSWVVCMQRHEWGEEVSGT